DAWSGDETRYLDIARHRDRGRAWQPGTGYGIENDRENGRNPRDRLRQLFIPCIAVFARCKQNVDGERLGPSVGDLVDQSCELVARPWPRSVGGECIAADIDHHDGVRTLHTRR